MDSATIDAPVVTATPTGVSTPAPNDWRTFMTDDLKADPVVSGWAEKASEKDVPSLVKGYAHLSKRLGSAVNLPGKDAKPEEVTAFKTRLMEAGLMPRPIADPKEYAITKPATLPPGAQWSDELSGKLASTLHKHQIPKEAVADLLALHTEALGGMSKSLEVDQEAAIAALKREHGEQYDERREVVKRMMGGILQSPEELAFLEETGLADHPKFLSVLMRLAPLAMQDSSFLESIPRTGGEISGDAAKEEYAKIMSDTNHPMHAGYLRKDPKVEAHINELYRSAYGHQPAGTR